MMPLPRRECAPRRPNIRPNAPISRRGLAPSRPAGARQSLDCRARPLASRHIGKAKLQAAIERTHALLRLPADYKLGIVPASDTGAMEMAIWSLLGPRPVTMLAWESFGAGWVTDVAKQLKLDADIRTADYGEICDLDGIDPAAILSSPGTARPAAFACPTATGSLPTAPAFPSATRPRPPLPGHRLGKDRCRHLQLAEGAGGEAAHGMLVLSPRAVERLEREPAPRPLPKIFRLTKSGKLIDGIFQRRDDQHALDAVRRGLAVRARLGGADRRARRR